jgi:hypothetical protein
MFTGPKGEKEDEPKPLGLAALEELFTKEVLDNERACEVISHKLELFKDTDLTIHFIDGRKVVVSGTLEALVSISKPRRGSITDLF